MPAAPTTPSATLTAVLTLTHGRTTPETAVPSREPYCFEITYTEESIKTVRVAAGAVDSLITLDSVGAPKFLLVQALETNVTVKLTDTVATDPAPTALVAGDGWIMIANPSGQPIKALLVTTPVSPATGALLRIVSVE
jgi:hypothetical protein